MPVSSVDQVASKDITKWSARAQLPRITCAVTTIAHVSSGCGTSTLSCSNLRFLTGIGRAMLTTVQPDLHTEDRANRFSMDNKSVFKAKALRCMRSRSSAGSAGRVRSKNRPRQHCKQICLQCWRAPPHSSKVLLFSRVVEWQCRLRR